MKTLDLKAVAEEFELVSSETHLFYNTEMGEFEFYHDFESREENDIAYSDNKK